MPIRTVLRWSRRLLLAGLFAIAGWIAYIFAHTHPEHLPWTPLDLTRPVGLFTGSKVADLAREPARCVGLIESTGLRLTALPAQGEGACVVPDAVRLAPGQAMLALSPSSVAPACPVVAGLAVWNWRVVGPAAQRLFGASVRRIDHYGSRACRRVYGRAAGPWSGHATADAIDVAGFTLSDGTRIDVLRDWAGAGPKARFLREVRDGACPLFATVLSPDYNAAHANHLHLEQADREMGWRACR